MAINISVSRLNRLHEASKDGLILLILTRVEAKDGVAVPTIVNSVSELHDKFEVRTSVESGEPVLVGLYQMYTAEYLLSTGATLLVYPTAGAGAFTGDPSINKTYYVENPPVPEPSTTYLTFRSNSSFSLKVNDSTKHWDGTLYYSTDLETWHEWDGTTILNSVDNKLYLRGKGNTVITGNNQNYKWVLEGSNIGCTGNIENLLDWEAVESGNHPSMASYCYAYLFYDCANLTSPPALPATTLADYCYAGMFSGCTALASAPALPATTLAYYCYNGMFRGCESLKVSSDPTETYRYEWRIPTSGTGTEAIGWNYSMLSGTGGTFKSDPYINTTYYVENPPVPEPNPTYLAFQSDSPFTLKVANSAKNWNGTLYYSTDLETWSVWSGTTTLSSVDNKLYLRGTGNTRITGNNQNYRWVLTGSNIECVGSIDSLLDYEYGTSFATKMANYCYAHLFRDCAALVSAPALPATTLSDYCYCYMFSGCTALASAPALPATTLANNCYDSMFRGCTTLASAPNLPATTLADHCYRSMFYGCTALTLPPALPATTLADYCYYYMFFGCESLASAPALPATTLADYCYQSMFQGCTALTSPPALPATTLADNCYNGMFSGCSSLTTAPALPVTTLADGCYRGMFWGCTSLTSAPALPATTLANSCYRNMFRDCTSLTSVPALPATTLACNCYDSMFYSCTALKVSSDPTETYQYAWRIPTRGTGTTASGWNIGMLWETGGTFPYDPDINKTYYVENPPVV